MSSGASANAGVGDEVSMRLGVMIGAERGDMARKVYKLVADIEWAESAGMDTAWMPQVPNDFDCLTMVALMARAHLAHRTRHRRRAAAGAASDRPCPPGTFGACVASAGGWRSASGRRTTGSCATCSASRTRSRPPTPATISRCSTPRSPVPARSTSRTTRSPCTTRPCSAPRRRCRCWWPRSGR